MLHLIVVRSLVLLLYDRHPSSVSSNFYEPRNAEQKAKLLEQSQILAKRSKRAQTSKKEFFDLIHELTTFKFCTCFILSYMRYEPIFNKDHRILMNQYLNQLVYLFPTHSICNSPFLCPSLGPSIGQVYLTRHTV